MEGHPGPASPARAQAQDKPGHDEKPPGLTTITDLFDPDAPIDWEAVKHDFVHSDLSLQRIADRHGTTPGTIRGHAKKGGWVRLVGTTPLRRGPKPKPPGTPKPTAAVRRNRKLVARLLAALDTGLTQLEARMSPDAGAEPMSAADAERDARSLNGLTRLYQKLAALDAEARAGLARTEEGDKRRRRRPMRMSSAALLRSALNDSIRLGTLDEFLAGLSAGELKRLHCDFELWAREDQLPPAAAQGGGAWTTWLMLGGRGAGKTRAGAEWVRTVAEGNPDARVALVAETLTDARRVMVEGVSGLLAVHPPDTRPLFEPSKRQLTWPSGAVAQLFSAEDPESLRGPQFSAAWCDELCKWRRPNEAWDMLQFGLRLGEVPRQVVTTTPRPTKLLKALLADPLVAVTRVSTAANEANLAPSFLEAIVGRYRGTRLGRQELDAELLEDRPGALWPRALIERSRVRGAPELRRIVVAVDPPVASGPEADACGIVVAGVSEEGRGYVLADLTRERASPLEWARAVVRAYRRYQADRVVAEVNQGGELVETVLRQIDPTVPVRAVRAMRGKFLRAEPVAALYEQGRIAHVGTFPELEDEMNDFGPDGLSGVGSPDRVDALVWALTDLMLRTPAEPRVRWV